ncbi:MAG: glycosyltransferase family 4 protein [Thermodesulfobacteriota bacterium]|nr:glycosyltransferase family 4 protein [Thermodesulfobacteriota bacterium]
MKRILFISPLPPPHGGIASWTKRVMESGLSSEYELCVVDTRIRGKRGFFDSVTFSLSEQKRFFSIVTALISHLINNRPDIVHLNCSLSKIGIFRDVFCGLIVRLWGIPLASHFRGNIPELSGKSLGDISLKALNLLIRLSHVNIAVNGISYEYLSKIVKAQRCEQIPNFVPDDIFKYQVHYEGASRGHTRALFVGGLAFAKGLAEIVETAKQLPFMRFDLIGEKTDDTNKIMGSLPHNIRLLGIMDNSSVIKEMCSSDLFFFPSHAEGFPNVVLEAMAVGLPVVSTKVGAIPEMIEDREGGFLVEPGDIDGMIYALRTLSDDARLRAAMGSFNRERSRKHYAYSAVARRLTSVYHRLLATGESAASSRS